MDSSRYCQSDTSETAPKMAGASVAVFGGSIGSVSQELTCTPNACNTGVKVFTGGLGAAAGPSVMAPSLHQVGLDWATLTLSKKWNQAVFYSVAYDLAVSYLDQGNEWQPFRFSGYEGFRCGPIAYGRREDGAMIRASSVAAALVFAGMANVEWADCDGKKCYGVEGVHVTRVDVQATLNYGSDLVDWARGLAARSLAARQAGLKHRGWQIHVREGYGTGDTLEIGSRSSECYGRVYDKHREAMSSQKEQNRGVGVGAFPLGCWRYEVEYKGSQAEQVWSHLRTSPAPDLAAGGLVRSWYGERGIELPLDLDRGPSLRSVRVTPDVERQLTWLAVSVVPTIQSLIGRGFSRELCAVLGMSLPVASEGASHA